MENQNPETETTTPETEAATSPQEVTTPNGPPPVNAFAMAKEALTGKSKQEKIERVAELIANLDWIAAVHAGGKAYQATLSSLLRPYGLGPQLLAELVDKAFPPEKTVEKEAPPTQYYGKDGQMAVKEKGEVVPLAEFNARIFEEIVKDNGSDMERSIEYRIGTIGEPRFPFIDVAAEDFAAMEWTSKWGARAILHPGKGVKDLARAAIQFLSAQDGVHRREVYAHVGWRKINGSWYFLTPKGAIGSGGDHIPVEVEFDKRFGLEASGDLVPAIQSSLRLLDVTKAVIAYPIVSAAYTSVLSAALDVDFGVWVKGRSGSMKTSYSVVVQNHFGAYTVKGMMTWEATANAIEDHLSAHKDVLSVVDDYVPRTGREQEITKAKIERIIQAIGNRSARARMLDADRKRARRDPQGLTLLTGEDVPPSGESTLGRVVIVPVQKGDIDTAKLTVTQSETRLLPTAMRGFIEWLAEGGDDRVTWLREERDRQIVDFRLKLGEKVHSRTPGNLATLTTGLAAFLRFATERGAVTKECAEESLQRGVTAFVGLGQESAGLSDGTPAQRFVAALRSLIQTGSLRLAHDEQTLAELSQGPIRGIGWVRGDEVLIDSTLAWDAVRRHYGAANWAYQERNVYRAMQDEKYLLRGNAQEQKEGRGAIQRTIDGRKLRVLAFEYATLGDYIPPKVDTTKTKKDDLSNY